MTSFLVDGEQVGRDALEHDLSPAEVLLRISKAFVAREAAGPAPELVPAQAGWWTEGGPRVAPRLETGSALPEGRRFAALIDDDWGRAETAPALAVARPSDVS
jgi:hypothetical protein